MVLMPPQYYYILGWEWNSCCETMIICLASQVGGGDWKPRLGDAVLSSNIWQKAEASYLVIQTLLLSIKDGQEFFPLAFKLELIEEVEVLEDVEGALQALHPRHFFRPFTSICFPSTWKKSKSWFDQIDEISDILKGWHEWWLIVHWWYLNSANAAKEAGAQSEHWVHIERLVIAFWPARNSHFIWIVLIILVPLSPLSPQYGQ